MMAKLRSLDRKKIDTIENVLIVLLSLTALFLVGKTGVFQAVTGQGSGQNAGAFGGVQSGILSQGEPVALMVRNQYGRYGVCYDQILADSLYSQGLEDLLVQSLGAMDTPRRTDQETWQEAVSQGEAWVFYDFLYDLSFSRQNDQEKGRTFLILGRNGRADSVYYQSHQTGDWYAAQIRDQEVLLPDLVGTLAPNEARFAFEDDALAEKLPAWVILLPRAPAVPVYLVSNPLAGLDEAGRTAFLEKLGFNLRATTAYESVDGTVLREGTDTLRVQEDGTLIYHGAQGGEARWKALSQREKDQQIKAEEVLGQIAGDLLGAGRLFCQSVTTLAEGETELIFCCLLSGAKVQLWDEGWTARVVFQGEDLTGFEFRLRRYDATPDLCAVLPLRQAAAGAGALGQGGKELQLCYFDDGSSQTVTAGWTVREGG